MKFNARVAAVVIAVSMFLLSGPAFAANWVYVGTTTLASGEQRVDYIDIDSVVKDVQTGNMVYWVRSENKTAVGSYRKVTKYMTKLGILSSTKYLEWHAYMDGFEFMGGTTPQQNWQDVEDTTLLGKAIEIARNKLMQ